MTGSASQAMDVVFRLLLGEKIVGRGSRGREGLGIGPRAEAGGYLDMFILGGCLACGAKFTKVKGLLGRGRLQELPKSSQDPSKHPQRGPKSCQRGSKRTPNTLQEHQKRSHSFIVS